MFELPLKVSVCNKNTVVLRSENWNLRSFVNQKLSAELLLIFTGIQWSFPLLINWLTFLFDLWILFAAREKGNSTYLEMELLFVRSCWSPTLEKQLCHSRTFRGISFAPGNIRKKTPSFFYQWKSWFLSLKPFSLVCMFCGVYCVDHCSIQQCFVNAYKHKHCFNA